MREKQKIEEETPAERLRKEEKKKTEVKKETPFGFKSGFMESKPKTKKKETPAEMEAKTQRVTQKPVEQKVEQKPVEQKVEQEQKTEKLEQKKEVKKEKPKKVITRGKKTIKPSIDLKPTIKIPKEAPKSSYEFEKNFVVLKGEHFHKYLKVMILFPH